MARKSDNQNAVRRYLLRQFSDAEQQEFELRLLGEDKLSEELEIGEDELIDEYLAQELSRDEGVRFEQHFLAHPERKRKLASGQALRRYLADVAPESGPTREPLPAPGKFERLLNSLRAYFSQHAVGMAVVVVAVLGFGIWREISYQSDVDKGLIALNAAYSQERPVEARITSLNYAPFVTRRGPEANSVKADEAKRQLAELTLLSALSIRPTPAVHHALGKVYLARNSFEGAIEQFEKALNGDSNNAQIYADLGAAYFEKGKTEIDRGHANRDNLQSGKGLENLARGLENFNKALQLNGNLLEALFNRGLTLEKQELWSQAELTWNDYLNHDSSSAWAQEAKRKLADLERRKRAGVRNKEQVLDEFMAAYNSRDDAAAWKLIRESYNSAGCPIANHLVSSFLSLPENQQSDREANLRALSYLGDLELSRAGDSYHSDLARFYGSLPPEQRQALAKVQDQMKQALDYLMTSRSREAIELYISSRAAFQRSGNSAEVIFTDYRLAHSYVIQPNLEKSQELFTRLSAECEKLNYRWLTGQSLVGLAHVSVGLNHYSEAIEFSKKGVALFQSSGYIDGEVGTLRQLAEEYQSINQIGESLGYLEESLAISGTHFIDPVVRWGLYTTVAFNLDSLGLLTATADYQKEALTIALEVGRPLVTSRSYAYLGATYGKLKDFSEAIKNLTNAYDAGAKLADEPGGMDMMANSSLQLGDLYRTTNEPAKALASYDQCLDAYEKLRMPYYNYAAHRGKLLTYVALQEDTATQKEISTILASLEEYRAGINEESQRNSFFETQQEIYDVAINFAYTRQQDPQAAFQYSETSRARTLLDSLQRTGRTVEGKSTEFKFNEVSSSLSLSAIQAAMPAGVQLIQYAVLDDKVLIWLVARDSFSVQEARIAKGALSDKIRSYLQGIARHSDEESQANLLEAESLYSLLIAPVEPLLHKDDVIVIVPEKTLNFVPFAALRSPQSKRYLIEDYNLEISPSASVFISSSKTATSKAQGDQEKLLSVGNPSFDRVKFSNIRDLPSATHEAETIAPFYKPAHLLVGEDAREQQIKAEMKSAEVIHLALHYLVDQDSQLLSELVLAKETHPKGNTEGELHAYEIYQLNLPRTKLAVLSACQTGIDRNFDGEGAVSIARPFLAAGVPLVVASLWPVESDSTAELMIQFHKHRKLDHRTTVESLSLAQRDMLKTTEYRHPYYWAPFVVIGGYARF